MAGRKEYKKIDIDVEPFLSIMAIVMKLISLILVVIVMRIAANRDKKHVVALEGLWDGSTGNTKNIKEPVYLDCFEDKVIIYPGSITNTWEALQKPGNPVEKLFDRIQANSTNEYVVVLARPQSVKFYRAIRRKLSQRGGIDVGADVVDAKYTVNWDAALGALSVSEEVPETATNNPPASVN
ncbi:MAG: hypothetical protein WCS70_00855 [Verrucomicrobiota bacterium]